MRKEYISWTEYQTRTEYVVLRQEWDGAPSPGVRVRAPPAQRAPEGAAHVNGLVRAAEGREAAGCAGSAVGGRRRSWDAFCVRQLRKLCGLSGDSCARREPLRGSV